MTTPQHNGLDEATLRTGFSNFPQAVVLIGAEIDGEPQGMDVDIAKAVAEKMGFQQTYGVTGQTYTMRCGPEDGNSFTCRGGNNAVVVLEDRAVRD